MYTFRTIRLTITMSDAQKTDKEWGEMIQSKLYWDERYKKDSRNGAEVFEWYLNFEALHAFLSEVIASSESRILELGCGNSTLSNDLSLSGYKCITAIDYSKVAIEQQQKLYPDNHVTYKTVDATRMSTKLVNNSFDCVIDKATLDSMMSGNEQNAISTVREVCKVLSNGGSYIIVSHVDPDTADGEHLLYNILIKNLAWKLCKYTVDIHSSESVIDNTDESLPHLYVIQQHNRPNTRLHKRRCESKVYESKDSIQITPMSTLPFHVAKDLILRRHFH